jgi:hypothetical protein
MTVVKKFKIRNRLRAALFDGGGKRIDDAVIDAEAGLETLAEACAGSIRDCIARIEADFGAGAAGREARSRDDLYRQSVLIIEACAPSAAASLAEAARNLCDLLDHCGETGRWDWPAVDIHINALKLLTAGIDLGEAGEQQLIQSLVKLRQHREQAA